MDRFAIFAILLSLSLQSYAAVDMKTGSYSNAWLDLDVANDGFQTKIVRIYKSRTLFDGIFGFGWCSFYESTLKRTAEGNIKISECGSGRETVYSLAPVSVTDIEKSVTGILQKMKADPKLTYSDDYYGKLREQLFLDADRRSDLAAEYKLTPEILSSKPYLSKAHPLDRVVLENQIFTRNKSDGTIEKFDLAGGLVQITDRAGNFIKLTRENGLPVKIEDGNMNTYYLKYSSGKKVSEIKTSNGQMAAYRYSGGDLVGVDVTREAKPLRNWIYKYDAFHNMIFAGDGGRHSVKLKYDTLHDWVTSFTGESGCVENYNYKNESQGRNLKHTVDTTTVCKGKKSTGKFEIWLETKPSGEVALSRGKTTSGAEFEDVTYDPISGKKLSLKTNSSQVEFEYFVNGLLKSRATKLQKTEYSYEDGQSAPATCKTTGFDNKGNVASTLLTNAKYDQKKRLIAVENSLGKKVQIAYDDKSRFSRLTNDKTEFILSYNERLNKPDEIKVPGLGSLKLIYGKAGEVKREISDKPGDSAQKIKLALQNTFDVITPVDAESLR